MMYAADVVCLAGFEILGDIGESPYRVGFMS